MGGCRALVYRRLLWRLKIPYHRIQLAFTFTYLPLPPHWHCNLLRLLFSSPPPQYTAIMAPNTEKEITMDEVKKHNTAEDCWLVIGNDATGE